jgi:carboxyl-terminal processing protease
MTLSCRSKHLVFALLLFCSPVISRASENDLWVGTGVDQAFMEQLFISTPQCTQSSLAFTACIEAINDALSELGGLYRVVPADLKKPFDGEFVEIQNPVLNEFTPLLSPLRLVEWRLSKTPSTALQRRDWQKQSNQFWLNLYTQVFTAAGPKEIRDIRFTESLSLAVKKIKIRQPSRSSESILAAAINRFLAISENPHTSLKTYAGFQKRINSTQTSFTGIGANLTKVGNKTYLSPLAGSSSELSGIQENDQLLRVDGVEVSNLDLGQIVEKLQGPFGSFVALDIERNQRIEMIISVERGQVTSNHVESSLLELTGKRYGYLRIATFAQKDLAVTVLHELRELSAKKIQGLVLDLRDNTGGLMDEATKIADLFLPKGTLIVSQEMTKKLQGVPDLQKEVRSRGGEFAHLPLIILINGRSASASEVITLALQENERAWVVGERSFGKGVGMTALRMPNNPGLLLWVTNFKFYGPAHQSNHISGIEPDFRSDPSPHLTADEKFVMREADLYYSIRNLEKRDFMHTFSRTVQKIGIEKCLEKAGHAQRFGHDLELQGRMTEIDLPLIEAQLVLDCDFQ